MEVSCSSTRVLVDLYAPVTFCKHCLWILFKCFCCNLQMIYAWCKDMHAFILCKSKNMGSCIDIIMAYAWPEMESNGIEMSRVLHHWECIALGTFVICINSGSSLFIHCNLYHISLLLILNQFQRIKSNSNKH